MPTRMPARRDWAGIGLAALAAVASLVLVVTPGTRAQVTQPAPVALRNLVFAVVPDFGPLLLDLYVPAASGPVPVILWVHGGGWSGGSKEGGPAVNFAGQGYAVASVQYRLSRDAIFPAQIHDVKAAVRWLRANAETYGLDADHIAVWGASAGGHLAALLGTSANVDDLEGTVGGNLEYSSQVQAVVDWFGPTDFLQMDAEALPDAMVQHDAPDSPEALLLGCPIQSCPDRADRASPLTYVSADAPPFLIMHGDQDRTVPVQQSQLLASALQAAGVSVELHVLPGVAHSLSDLSTPAILGQVKAFLDTHLSP